MGILSKWHQSNNGNNISSVGFMFLSSFIGTILCLFILTIMYLKNKKISVSSPQKSAIHISCYGLLNGIGNLLLLVSLIHLPASVQYPMITGGVIIVSTLISLILKEKIKKRSFFAIILAFASLILLV